MGSPPHDSVRSRSMWFSPSQSAKMTLRHRACHWAIWPISRGLKRVRLNLIVPYKGLIRDLMSSLWSCNPALRLEMQLRETEELSQYFQPALCQQSRCFFLDGSTPLVFFLSWCWDHLPPSPGAGGWWWRSGRLGSRWGPMTDGGAGTQSPWAGPAVSSLIPEVSCFPLPFHFTFPTLFL